MIDRHAILALTPSPIHISGNNKPDVSRFLNPKYFNIVLIIKITVIHILILRKTKNTSHTAAVDTVRPKFILLHERYRFFLLIKRKFNISV